MEKTELNEGLIAYLTGRGFKNALESHCGTPFRTECIQVWNRENLCRIRYFDNERNGTVRGICSEPVHEI